MLSNIKITQSEWEVMRILWAEPSCTSQHISKILSQKMAWKPTTVSTLLARLLKKNMISRTKQEGRYQYFSLIQENQAWKAMDHALLERVCARKMGQRIASLIQTTALSFDDLELLNQVLQEKQKTAVQELACDCIPGQCDCEPGTCLVS